MQLACENDAWKCPNVPRRVCTVVPASGSRSSIGDRAEARHRNERPPPHQLTPRSASELGPGCRPSESRPAEWRGLPSQRPAWNGCLNCDAPTATAPAGDRVRPWRAPRRWPAARPAVAAWPVEVMGCLAPFPARWVSGFWQVDAQDPRSCLARDRRTSRSPGTGSSMRSLGRLGQRREGWAASPQTFHRSGQPCDPL